MEKFPTVSIMTINRPVNNYLYQTLKNMESTFDKDTTIHLFVGNTDNTYLLPSQIGTYFRFVIYPVTTAVWNQTIKTKKCRNIKLSESLTFIKASWNYSRILLANDNPFGVLVIEDDVDFHPQFIEYFHKINRLIEHEGTSGDPDYVITFYNFWSKKKPRPRKKLEIVKAKHGFSCTQCMFFTSSIAKSYGQYLADNLGKLPYDILLWHYCKKTGTPLYRIKPSLVQHQGTVTTGLGYVHTSASFSKQEQYSSINFKLSH